LVVNNISFRRAGTPAGPETDPDIYTAVRSDDFLADTEIAWRAA
jgi:hypothetical protein